MSDFEPIYGGCICGSVKYSINSKPLFTQVCHCLDCKKCGVYIYADYEFAVGRLTVRTKTLLKPKNFPPQAHIFVKDKDPWINIVNKDICYDEMYDPKIAWPKESLDRYKEYLETN